MTVRRAAAIGQVAAVPVAAITIIAFAVLWERRAIPLVQPVSGLVGLAAVLLAPGLAIEPVLRGTSWTNVERFGFAAVMSVASTAIAGVALHVTGLSISTANVLLLLLVTSAVFGTASLPYRGRRISVMPPHTMRVDVLAGVGSLALLAFAFGIVVIAPRSVPQPPLEVAIVDDAGALIELPLGVVMHAETTLNVAVRSPSGTVTTATMTIQGYGLRPWSNDHVHASGVWSIVEMPVEPLLTGTLRPTLAVRGGGVELRVPIEIHVIP